MNQSYYGTKSNWRRKLPETTKNLNEIKNENKMNKTVIYKRYKHTNITQSIPKEQIALKVSANKPVQKAMYKLQCYDNIAGFTQNTILGTYKRLTENYIKRSPSKKHESYEKFPEKQISDEIKNHSLNYSNLNKEIVQHDVEKWLGEKHVDKNSFENDKKVIEFAKNMFLSWDTENKGSFSIDKIIEELVSLGLAIDSKIITSLVTTFKNKKLGQKPSGKTEIKVEEFLKFMRGDKISMHISSILKGIREKNDEIFDNNDKNVGEKTPRMQKKSISYKIPEIKNTFIEIPVNSKKNQVLLHTVNNENENISMHLSYDNEGNLISKKSINHTRNYASKIMSNFEKSLEKQNIITVPHKPGEKMPPNIPNSKPHKLNKTLEEIKIVQDWWAELEKKTRAREYIPLNDVADFLVEKTVAPNRDKAKLLLLANKNEDNGVPNKYVDFMEFKQLMYKGIFRNAIKYIYGEVKESSKSENLPEFMQIANYKKKLLMTAFDPDNPQHQQGIQIYNTLKKQYEKTNNSIFTKYNLPNLDLTEPTIPLSLNKQDKYHEKCIPGKISSNLYSFRKKQEENKMREELIDQKSIMQKYRELISEKPEINEFLVYHGCLTNK